MGGGGGLGGGGMIVVVVVVITGNIKNLLMLLQIGCKLICRNYTECC